MENKTGFCCIKCGRSDISYEAKGLCQKCYRSPSSLDKKAKKEYDKKYYQKTKIKRAIRERGKYDYMAKDRNPTLARKAELIALRILRGAIDRNKTSQAHYDIDWDGKKIDVKSANLKKTRYKAKRWSFTLHQKGEVDYFLLFCFDQGILIHIVLLPDKATKSKYIDIRPSTISKYSKYLLQ